MKILLVHNNYGKYSGEEAVVDTMMHIYTSLDYEVIQYRKSTEAIQNTTVGKIDAFVKGIFPSMCVREFEIAFERYKPDVVHIHNLYPFIGGAILQLCKSRGAKVLMTVHNYRLMCPTGLFMRNERPCEECLSQNNEWSCIKYNCEGSFFKSLGYALRNMVARKRKYYIDNVDKFCCLTNFQRDKLIEAGFDESKISVIPNACSRELSITTNNTNNYIGYIGRLSVEKGIDMIFEVARRNPHIEFRFAGATRGEFGEIPPNCTLMGHLKDEAFDSFIGNSRFIVMASRCYEGFPMAVLDAIAYNKCVVGPNHGGFSEIIFNDGEPIGELFVPNDVDDMQKTIVSLWDDDRRINEYSSNSLTTYKNIFSKSVIRDRWSNLIESLND